MKYKKWIDTEDTAIINGVDVNILMCPKCESRVIVLPMDNSEANFCPNCGADLRDEERRESEDKG